MYESTDKMFETANEYVKKLKLATLNNTIVVTCGTPKQHGCTNLIKIQRVE